VTDTDTRSEQRHDEAVERHLAELRGDGYSIRRDALAPELCDELVATIAGMASTWGRSLVPSFHGRRTVRYFDLLNGPAVFPALPIHENILPVAPAVLGEHCLLKAAPTTPIAIVSE
jgi:hypothetical protein